MGLNFEAKRVVVKKIGEVVANSTSLVAAEYGGLSVAEMTQLRAYARDSDVYISVVKNTLARRALKDTQFNCMCGDLKGQLVLAFSGEEVGAAVKLFRDFSKGNAKLVIRLVAFDGKLLEPKEITALENLPSREMTLGMLSGAMIAPVACLARTLVEPYSGLVRATKAVADQRMIS